REQVEERSDVAVEKIAHGPGSSLVPGRGVPQSRESRLRSASSTGGSGKYPTLARADSRSATSAARNCASASARATISSSFPRDSGNTFAASTQAAGAGGSARRSSASLSISRSVTRYHPHHPDDG